MTLSLSFHEAKVSTRPTVSPLQYGNSEILQLPVRVWKYKAAILKLILTHLLLKLPVTPSPNVPSFNF